MKRARDQWGSLREQAERLLLANHKTEVLGDALSNVTYRFPIPCEDASSLQESTSSLFAARAYAKAGRSRDAWEAIESLFSVQSTNGMIPKFRYSPSNDTRSFVNDTDIPNWPLFQNASQSFFPPETSLANKLGVRSSGRLSGVPLHATLVLEIFYLSNQTNDDLLHLQKCFDRLYRSHNYLHTVVMRGCHSLNNHPCYNVVHPWETLMETQSPLVVTAMQQVNELMDKLGWEPPVPTKENASLFLLECIKNATFDCLHNCEEELLEHCPFAMLDVGYAAFLQKADSDILEMAHILQGKHQSELHLIQLLEWKEQSTFIMDNLLWNEEHQSFQSRMISFEETNSTDSYFVPVTSQWLEHAVANNFLGLWGKITNESRRDSMMFHMWERQGNFSFDCGAYPLWSTGGCEDATVSPLVNYLVSRALHMNSVLGMDTYLANSTCNLICGLPNQVVHDNAEMCGNVSFWNQYNGSSGTPISLNHGETITAAVVYNLLVADKPFHYIPAPPIRGSWVITLVVAELVIAFCFGVCCLILNLNMLRRLNADSDGDDFVRLLENEGEALYFSATASLEEEANDRPS